MTRTVKVGERKDKIVYAGTKSILIDPLDFIIDTKKTNPQDALYVGHRAMLSVKQIRQYGKQFGWLHMDEIEKGPTQQTNQNLDIYRWARDPTSLYGTMGGQAPSDSRPSVVEVVFLYALLSLDDGQTYDDYQIVMAAGRVILDLRVNPNDGQFRPYATWRATNNGHDFYGTGLFDNAIRINQHLDRSYQTFSRGAAIAGMPIAFAEEDSDMPDSLYKVRPLSVFKGVGPVRFTQIPDGFLRAAPLMTGMFKRDIEETVGAFRINMGQDDGGGTATEATISLQEGNRRMRSIVRAVAEGLEQMLLIFHKNNLQYSNEYIEFPVLGKRALDLRKTHMNMTPADLLEDVKFDLVGLHSMRTYGLRATGFQAVMNSFAPFIMAHPNEVDTLAMLHDGMSELIGPDDADRYVKMPTPIDRLRSQHEENEGLIAGSEIEVEEDDDHTAHMRDLQPLVVRPLDKESKMNPEVRRVIVQHYIQHDYYRKRQQAQEAVREKRQAATAAMVPPEAGGQQSPATGRSSPQRGGMSNAMAELSTGPPGQAPMENPGPPDQRKYSRSGGAKRTTNQSQNTLAP